MAVWGLPVGGINMKLVCLLLLLALSCGQPVTNILAPGEPVLIETTISHGKEVLFRQNYTFRYSDDQPPIETPLSLDIPAAL
jgi:hypothetical protein